VLGRRLHRRSISDRNRDSHAHAYTNTDPHYNTYGDSHADANADENSDTHSYK
jgi:hypothetical protein